eukprot:scaffold51672_cov22-Phaeocystis_antarctica.AAC.1
MPISFRSSSVQWARSRPRSGTTMHTSAYLPSLMLCSTQATSASLSSTSGVVARPATTETESSGEMRLSSAIVQRYRGSRQGSRRRAARRRGHAISRG